MYYKLKLSKFREGMDFRKKASASSASTTQATAFSNSFTAGSACAVSLNK